MPQADADPMAAKGNHSPATGNVVSSIHQRMQQQSRPSPAPNVVECPSLSDTSVVSRRTTSGETHSRRSRMCEPVKRAEVERSSASAFVAGADSVLRAQLTGQSEQLAALANRQAAPNLPFSPGPFPFFPWMQMQPFGPAAVPPAQPTLMDAATARAYANAYPWENFMMTAKAENERRGVDGTSPTWRVGSAGGYVPGSPFYPIPVPALWYGSAAAAVAVANDGAKNAALANAGSRPNSPRSKKRTFDETSISPTSDRSTVMDFIRHSPTSLFHNSGVNSRSSSAASIGSFGHLAVGPVNPALSHFRGSPVMGPFGAASPPFPLFMPSPFGVSKPELTPTAPMNGHTSPYSCFGFPFPNGPIVTNFHPAGASLPFPTMGYPISVVPDAKEAKAVASVDEKPMDKGAGGLDKAGGDDEEETIEMEKTQSRSREPSGSSIDVDVDGPVVKEELVDIKEEPVDTNCRWIGCGLPFATQADLVRHVSLAHVESTQEGFVCRWSSCDRGGKAFKAKYMLSVHMRRHTGDKPHVCSIEGCGKAYSRLENLKTHLRSHTGDKPYTCEFPGCGKSFTNASDRAKHESRTHSDQKRYVCGYPGCTSKYTDPSSLRKHVKTKHGDEAFLKKKHKPSEPDSGGGTMNTHEPGNTDPSSMTGSGGKVGFVIRTESTGYSNPGSNQTTIGSVDSPITNSTSNTDGQCSSVSPFHTDSGVEMSTPSDNMSALIEHVLQASEAENEDLAARMVATVSGFGNDEENDGVADDLASHVQRVRRRMAAKANLATVYAGDVVASKVDRVAEYVSEQSRLYGNSYRPTCNIRPPAQDIGMTTIQLPTKTLVSVSYRPHKPSQILTAGGSCTSATSSDYGSLHSAGTTATSYPSSVLSSPGASRPDSVMSYASQQTPNYAEMGYSPALSQCPRSSQGFGPMGHHRQQEDVWNGANLRSPRHVGCGSYNFPNECSSGCCCVHGQNRRNELADPETMRRMSEYARRMRKDDTDDGGYPRSDWAKSRWLAQEGSTVDGVDRQWARSVGCPHAHRRSDRDVAYDRPGTAVQITSSPSPPCCSQHYQRNGAGGALRQAPVQCGNYQQPQLPHLNQQQSPHPHLQQSPHLRHQPPMFRSPRPAVNGVTYGMESAPRNVLEVEVLDLMNGVKEIDIGRSGGNTITTGQQSNCAYSFENITLADMASNLASFIKENRSFHTR